MGPPLEIKELKQRLEKEQVSDDLTRIDSIGGNPIYSVSGNPRSFMFRAGASIDADGSPTAYGPANTGDDWTDNAGNPDDWWGLSCGDDGSPYTQKIYHAAPGYYVSTTALENPIYPVTNPARFMDSKSIPFFVLPSGHNCGAHLGDVGLVYNTHSLDNCYGIYADIGPSAHLGEISCRMAQALNLDPDPKGGGIEDRRIIYVVFPGSVGKYVVPELWFDVANTLFKAWGGLTRLQHLVPQMP
jgi:hypothetical protein